MHLPEMAGHFVIRLVAGKARLSKGRLGVGMNEMLGYAELPVLMPGKCALELIMIHAHNQHQRGAKDTLWRSHSLAQLSLDHMREEFSRES